MSAPVLVGLDVVPSSGGAVKTLGLFAEALGGRVVSFTDPRRLAAEGSAVPGALHVPVSPGLPGRLYSRVSRRALAEADALAAAAPLLTCHILYRDHVHFVARHARRRRVPYWVVPHGSLDPWVFTYRAWMKRPWMALVGRRFLRGAAAVVCATAREAAKAEPWLRGCAVRVVHWPVGLVDLGPREADRAAVRAALGLPADAGLLLLLGRIHPMKRPLETIGLLASLGEAARGWHLVVVGPEEGVVAGELLGRARALGLAGRVHVPGPAFGPAKDRWLRGADALASFSHRENFGHTVAESLAAGTPVVLGPGIDLGAELEPAGAGWFAAEDTPASWAGALAACVAATADGRAARGLAGRAWVASRLSADRFREELRRLAAAGADAQAASSALITGMPSR